MFLVLFYHCAAYVDTALASNIEWNTAVWAYRSRLLVHEDDYPKSSHLRIFLL